MIIYIKYLILNIRMKQFLLIYLSTLILFVGSTNSTYETQGYAIAVSYDSERPYPFLPVFNNSY